MYIICEHLLLQAGLTAEWAVVQPHWLCFCPHWPYLTVLLRDTTGMMEAANLLAGQVYRCRLHACAGLSRHHVVKTELPRHQQRLGRWPTLGVSTEAPHDGAAQAPQLGKVGFRIRPLPWQLRTPREGRKHSMPSRCGVHPLLWKGLLPGYKLKSDHAHSPHVGGRVHCNRVVSCLQSKRYLG